jgi:hypothetical protein
MADAPYKLSMTLPNSAAQRNDAMCQDQTSQARCCTPGYWARRAKSGLGQFLQISFAHAAALVFGLFLPASDATVSTLAALSVYALGYAIVPQSNEAMK